MVKRYNFKSLDMRTGRLERASTLLEDGERAKIRTREPDPLHPQSRPRTIGLDRAQIIPAGMLGEQKLEDRQIKFAVGYTADSTLKVALRGTVAFTLHSGGCKVNLTDAFGTFTITLGD